MDPIKKQLEFYFSDCNFSKDKFLIETAANNNGLIPISTLLTFKRLQKLNANNEKIKESLVDSKVIKVEGDFLKKIETEEFKNYKNNTEENIVYITGFPTNFELENIENYLNENTTGIPLRITMRRNKNKEFTGSCFVEYKSKIEVESIIKKFNENQKDNEDQKDTEGGKKDDEDQKVNEDNLDKKDQKVNEEEEDENVKKIKIENNFELKVLLKSDYLNSKNPEERSKQAIEKIKNDFKPKLYKLELLEEIKELTIPVIKELLPNSAFIDLKKNIVRMKYIEEWEEKEFEKIKLVKLSKEEAQKYVDELNIKPKLSQKVINKKVINKKGHKENA